MSEHVKGEVVICRACISECLDYKSLYKQGLILGEVTTLATLLKFCTNLDFDTEDLLPAHMCNRCVQNLARAYMFKKTVLEANDLLRKQHSEFCGSNNLDLIVDGEGEDVSDSQQYMEDVGAEELQELANAAQLHRNMEYVTLTLLRSESTEEDAVTLEVADGGDVKTLEVEEGEEVVMHDITESTEVYSTDDHSYLTEVEAEGDVHADTDVDVTSKEHIEVETFETVSWHDTEEEEDQDQQQQLEDDDDVIDQEQNSADDASTLSVMSKPVSLKRRAPGTVQHKQPQQQQLQIHPPKPKIPRMRNKTNEPKATNRDLQCNICGKQLSNNNSFKYHMQLHSEHTPYLCSLCGEGFKTRNAYEGHIVIHDPNNPNTCEICGKSYRQASSLRTHMLSHSGEKPYRCEICGKGMTQKSGYKKHLLTHTGEMPHSCDICGRAFRYSSNLLAHKRWHSGEKPFECEHCNRCFPTAEQRKRHRLVHSGERPFSCTICHKAFKRRSALASHYNIHETRNEDKLNVKSDSGGVNSRSTNNDKQTDIVVEEDEEDEDVIDQKMCKSNVIELC